VRLYRAACRVSRLDPHARMVWRGVRRAGLGEAKPGADAAPAAPRGAALI